MKLSAPTTINGEITEKYNSRCIYCYNPWRKETKEINSYTFEVIKKTKKNKN